MVPLPAGQGEEFAGPPLELPPEPPPGLVVALGLVALGPVVLELVVLELVVLPLVAVPAVEEDDVPPAGEDRVPPVAEAPLGAVDEVMPVVDILEVEGPGRLLPVDIAVDKLDDDMLSEIEMFPIEGL